MTDAGDDAFTVDTLLRGRVTLLQPARGPRSSLDPVLLAGFVRAPYGRFLDIGGGSGALSFLLLAADAAAAGVAVELDACLARLAVAGRARNGWDARLAIHEADVRRLGAALPAAGFDLVVTNPPFYAVGAGQLPPDLTRARASHELALTLAEWLDVAARAVRPGGRVAAIFPAERLIELGAEMRARDLAPTRLRAVHPFADRPASRVLVEAERAGRRPLAVEPPLILHEAEQRFTAEVKRMLGEDQP
jgi:tRNA1Val (adenine37-N6)-methyltransferase